MLWVGRNTASKCLRGVLVPHWVCPHSRCVCFPSLHCSGSRMLCRELCEAGLRMHALPQSKPLRFRFSGTRQRPRLGWASVLCPSQVRAAQVTRCLASTVAPSWRLHLITSPVPAAQFSCVQRARLLRCAMCLFWGADLWLRPSYLTLWSTIQNPKKSWLAMKPACSLVEDASLELQLPPSGSGCPRLPVSSGGSASPQPASSAQSFAL